MPVWLWCVLAALVLPALVAAAVQEAMLARPWIGDPVFSADGARVYAFGASGAVKRRWLGAWDVETGRRLWRVDGDRNLYQLLVIPGDGALLTAGAEMALRDARTGEKRWGVRCDGVGDVYPCVVSPDGARVLRGRPEGVQVWDADTGDPIDFWKVPDGRTGWPSRLSFSDDGTRVLVGAHGWMDSTGLRGTDFLQLWDGRSGALLHDFGEGFSLGTLSGDGRRVAVWYGRKVLFQDTDSESAWVASPELPAEFECRSLVFRADGALALDGERRKVGEAVLPQRFVWNPATSCLDPEIPPEGTVSPDGRWEARRGRGGRRSPLVTIHNASTGAHLRDLR